MYRIPFLILFSVIGLAYALFTDDLAAFGGETPQNILLIIADDYGLDQAELYNTTGTPAPTPFINSMRAHGVQFDNVWGYPVCSPTRASMLTGRYGFRTGVGAVVQGNDPGIPLNEFTIPKALDLGTNSAYAHANIGKWHISNADNGGRQNPLLMGYDHYSGILSGSVNDYTAWRESINGARPITNTNYTTTEFVDDALTWIDQQTQSNTPWFLWLALNAPHTPFHLPPTDLHTQTHLPGDQADIDANPLGYYQAAVEAMDHELERLLSTLPSDVRQNTTVIFIGDNGTPRQVVAPPYPRRQSKGSLLNGGIQVPMIISSTRVVDPGRNVSGLVNGVDMFATVLELAGVDVAATVTNTAGLDSVSMVPYLSNPEQASLRDRVYSEAFSVDDVTSGGMTMQDGRYKLIIYNDGSEAFYDLDQDLFEDDNLLDNTLDESVEDAYCELYQDIVDLRSSEAGAAVPTLPNQCAVPLAVEMSGGTFSAETHLPQTLLLLFAIPIGILIYRKVRTQQEPS